MSRVADYNPLKVALALATVNLDASSKLTASWTPRQRIEAMEWALAEKKLRESDPPGCHASHPLPEHLKGLKPLSKPPVTHALAAGEHPCAVSADHGPGTHPTPPLDGKPTFLCKACHALWLASGYAKQAQEEVRQVLGAPRLWTVISVRSEKDLAEVQEFLRALQALKPGAITGIHFAITGEMGMPAVDPETAGLWSTKLWRWLKTRPSEDLLRAQEKLADVGRAVSILALRKLAPEDLATVEEWAVWKGRHIRAEVTLKEWEEAAKRGEAPNPSGGSLIVNLAHPTDAYICTATRPWQQQRKQAVHPDFFDEGSASDDLYYFICPWCGHRHTAEIPD